MRQETVHWKDQFCVNTEELTSSLLCHPCRNRYDLATALRVVRQMETSPGRALVFEDIKNKNRLYRLVDAFYSKSTMGGMQPLLLFAYMLKCSVSVGPFQDNCPEAVSISNFANEHHTVERVAALVPDVRLLRLSIKRWHMLSLRQLAAALRMIACFWRLRSFLKILARSHSFMPSARIASALAFYMRFSQLFTERPTLNAAVVTSNYSPEAVGMAAAAHEFGRRVVYANHAPVPANGEVVPPVLADCALFYGDSNRQTYERRSRCTAEIALIGQPWTSRSMEWQDEVKTVGIFLTAGTRTEVLSGLVSSIRLTWPGVRILIRNHPVALVKTDLTVLAANAGNIKVTIGNPLDDEISACDLIICGNSGVAMNVLSGGRPVAYLACLDRSVYDCNGFVESGLVYEMSGWCDDIYDRLKTFYRAPGWLDIMRTYDASYGTDSSSLAKTAAETLLRHLRPLEPDLANPLRSGSPAAFRAGA